MSRPGDIDHPTMEVTLPPHPPGSLGWRIVGLTEGAFVPNDPEIKRQAEQLAADAENYAAGGEA
jgi:hypothetical protein